jgi:hypothetical protein
MVVISFLDVVYNFWLLASTYACDIARGTGAGGDGFSIAYFGREVKGFCPIRGISEGNSGRFLATYTKTF